MNYQVVILDPAGKFLADFQATLTQRFSDLGISTDFIKYFDEKNFFDLDPKAPIAGVYFGFSDAGQQCLNAITLLKEKAAILIPVVSDLEKYTASVPEVLHEINGYQLRATTACYEEIVSAVLEAFLLLRKSRKLFISYKRDESRTAAVQLYEELDQHGFDVFLDTHSVKIGEYFQEVLWHRLSDADIMIMLDTPKFFVSKWTVEERARAIALKIGILQLVWPTQNAKSDSALCFPHYLNEPDFEGVFDLTNPDNKLTSHKVAAIVAMVESLRARALAARHESLVHEFCLAASRVGASAVVQPNRHIRLCTQSGAVKFLVPTVGVPTSVGYEEAAGKEQTFLLYDHAGIRDEWCRHLSWLDGYLPVNSVKITEAEKWIKSLP